METIPIVDKNDDIIKFKERDSLDPSDIYRVSALWLTNSFGEILLAQRSLSKKHSPGKWGPAVAGTVTINEDYDSNIIKEAKEELGIEGLEFLKGPKNIIKGKHTYFVQWYLVNINKPKEYFLINKEEVTQIKWFDYKELLVDIKNNPNNYVEGLKVFFIKNTVLV